MGDHIYEYRPEAKIRRDIMNNVTQDKFSYSPIIAIHANSMVFDGKITVIRIFNLDPWIANLNTECVTIIHSKDISNSVQSLMGKLVQAENSWKATKNFNPDSKVKRLKRFKM